MMQPADNGDKVFIDLEALKDLLSQINKPVKTYKKGWDAARAEKQRQLILKHKIWEKSTGAKTPEGKAIVSQNARKHGLSEIFNQNDNIKRAFYGEKKPKKPK